MKFYQLKRDTLKWSKIFFCTETRAAEDKWWGKRTRDNVVLLGFLLSEGVEGKRGVVAW